MATSAADDANCKDPGTTPDKGRKSTLGSVLSSGSSTYASGFDNLLTTTFAPLYRLPKVHSIRHLDVIFETYSSASLLRAYIICLHLDGTPSFGNDNLPQICDDSGTIVTCQRSRGGIH